MNKNQFMNQLKRRIKALPKEERESAIDFYEEYFAEAESEEIAIEKLGDPKKIAAKLLVEFAEKKPEMNKLWLGLIIISLIFAIPFGFVGVVLAFVLLVLLFVIVTVLFSINFAFFSMACGYLVAVIPAFIYSFPTGLVCLGGLLVSAALTYWFFLIWWKTGKFILKITKTAIIKIAKRGYQNEK